MNCTSCQREPTTSIPRAPYLRFLQGGLDGARFPFSYKVSNGFIGLTEGSRLSIEGWSASMVYAPSFGRSGPRFKSPRPHHSPPAHMFCLIFDKASFEHLASRSRSLWGVPCLSIDVATLAIVRGDKPVDMVVDAANLVQAEEAFTGDESVS